MTPTATYIAEENCLQELPQMADPGTCPNELDGIEKCNACKNLAVSYNAHLATLRKIPCDPSCKGLWADGQKVVENMDYQVANRVTPPKLLAFPLVPVKSEGQPGEIEKLRAENSKMRKALEWISNEGLRANEIDYFQPLNRIWSAATEALK